MKKTKINFNIIYTLAILFPTISFAALSGFKCLLSEIIGMMNSFISLVFALAMLFFFWGGAQFILKDAGNDKTREDGKKKMLWGIIALFVMFSIYGILKMVQNLTGISRSGSFNGQSGGFVTCLEDPTQNGCNTNN